MRFVKGSHLWPKLCHPRVFLGGGNFNTEDESLQAHAGHRGRSRGLSDPRLGPGPGRRESSFTFRTDHGSTAAEVGARRRAFVTRWMGDDMTYCERPGEISPPYENHGMKDGERMREDWFPVLWRKA